jgi:hypothetical protein
MYPDLPQTHHCTRRVGSTLGLRVVPALGATCFLWVHASVAVGAVNIVPPVRVVQSMATAPGEGVLLAVRATTARRRGNAPVHPCRRSAED